MFEREHHRRIEAVLQALDADVLLADRCLFGGGTAMALRHGEYRESVDIDFMVSDIEGYRRMRQRLTGSKGLLALARPGALLEPVREVRADQYGIRSMLDVDGAKIKFEIVLEGRIEIEPPGPDDRLCGVATLTRLDMATSKLLANSDRWADDAVFSRDLIDLAMMKPDKPLLAFAIAKARAAYGDSVERDLAKAVESLRKRPHRLDQCMQVLGVTVSKAVLWQRIRSLQGRSRS